MTIQLTTWHSPLQSRVFKLVTKILSDSVPAGPVPVVYASGATGMGEGSSFQLGDSPARPFISMRNDPSDIGVSKVKQDRMSFLVHDEPGSMNKVNALCNVLRYNLPEFENWEAPKIATSSCILMSIEFQTVGPDGFDDHYRTITRYVDFLITYCIEE